MENVKKKSLRITGTFLFFVGMLLIFNPMSGITGYSIAKDVNENPTSIFSISCIIIGLIVFLFGIEKKEKDIKEYIQEGLEMPEEAPK